MTAGVYALAGPSIVIENLAEQLCKKGNEVTLGAFTFQRVPPKAKYNVSKLPVYSPLRLRTFLQKFDIVHNHHPVMNFLSFFSHGPFAYHYHGAPDFGKGYLLRFSMFSSIKLMKHTLDAVIAVSECGHSELKEYFNLENVHVIYNGVNTELFRYGIEEKFRKGNPQFLFVGNLYAHKKVEELIFGMREVLKLFPKALLQIIGKGQMYNKLKALIAELGLEKHVELVGRVGNCDLPHYYASCDVYVTASRWELFGLPLLEAMACGKPVVASTIPPHMELISRSKAGTTYAKGNVENLCKKMIETYENAEKYRVLATHFAKEHDWALVADRLVKLYNNLLSNMAC